MPLSPRIPLAVSAVLSFALLGATASAATPRVCTLQVIKEIDSACQFCSCDKISRQAIWYLRNHSNQIWLLRDAREQCPAAAGLVLRGPRHVSDDTPVVVSPAQPVPDQPVELVTTVIVPTETNVRDDNGHGNDPDGVDSSNPGGKL